MKPLATTPVSPDKNTIEYKALAEAACAANVGSRLMLATGGIRSRKSCIWRNFISSISPKVWLSGDYAGLMTDLPVADVQAFSIDDVTRLKLTCVFRR
jgi:exoribonuclease-2